MFKISSILSVASVSAYTSLIEQSEPNYYIHAHKLSFTQHFYNLTPRHQFSTATLSAATGWLNMYQLKGMKLNTLLKNQTGNPNKNSFETDIGSIYGIHQAPSQSTHRPQILSFTAISNLSVPQGSGIEKVTLTNKICLNSKQQIILAQMSWVLWWAD